jgi:hypothetical protein
MPTLRGVAIPRLTAESLSSPYGKPNATMARNLLWNTSPDQRTQHEANEHPRGDALTSFKPYTRYTSKQAGWGFYPGDTHGHDDSSSTNAAEDANRSSGTVDNSCWRRRYSPRARTWPRLASNRGHARYQRASESRNSVYRAYRLQRWLVESPSNGTCPRVGTRDAEMPGAMDGSILEMVPGSAELHVGASLAVEKVDNELRFTGSWCVDKVG